MAKYIFFIHGYSSSSKKAWGEFPDFIKSEFGEEYVVDCLDYPSPNKLKFWKPAPNHLSIAEGFVTDLRYRCENLNSDEIIFVAHSNGGIVVKKLIQQLELHSIKHNITKICFLDVPHTGSGWANVGRIVNPLNKHLGALNSNSDSLSEINTRWIKEKHESRIRILNLIATIDDVVSRSSSSLNYPDTVTIPNVNHAGIAKPSQKSDCVVTELSKFIQSSTNLDFYIIPHSKAYKDWRRIDRSHKLNYVEDEQRILAFSSLEYAFHNEKPLVRLTGLSGLGKSRLIVKYIDKYKIPEDFILIYNASTNCENILEKLVKAYDSQLAALIVVENCSVILHDKIAKVFNNTHKLKIITVDFYHDKVQSSAHIKLQQLSTEKIGDLIKQLLPKASQGYVERLSKFVEGFPLLVEMLVTNLRDSGELSAGFSESDLVEKLINGDDSLNDKHRQILRVMSLFDVFSYEKLTGEEISDGKELINKISDSKNIDFDFVITKYREKELINIAGRFARITPKPLAINLAMEWWSSSLFERQKELIESIPESLIESFCKQITFLDSSINVQNFVEKFCNQKKPFGQAELLLSKQGSRLFRALVEVNPQVTTNLLNRVLSGLSNDEIRNIVGDVRRNLVWSLEMLVFHNFCFEKAAWCLFKLAQFENESYGNNATAQFSQLFRRQLSGTEANFEQRLVVLNRVLTLNVESADIVIIEAVKSAIDTHVGTRIIGAEFQGTKVKLTEWHPKTYQEICEYWQSLLNILLDVIKRDCLVEKAKDAFGYKIRGLMNYEHEMKDQLDSFIKEVVILTGKYWPSAAQSITHTLHYDSKEMESGLVDLLKSWEQLLSPEDDNIEEMLKLIVLNPSREHVIDDDGHYKDVAAEGAEQLAKKFKNSFSDLYQYLGLLMTFSEQKQSWMFAKHLILEVNEVEGLLNEVIGYLRNHSGVNTRFFSGLLFGLNIKEPIKWESIIKLIGSDENLIEYYPDSIITGILQSSHLDVFIELIKEDKLSSYVALKLARGGATKYLTEKEITQFCMPLSEIDATAVWVALNCIDTYLHRNEEINFNQLIPTLVHLVLNVSFKKEDKSNYGDSYCWLNSVERLLQLKDKEFALKLCLYLIDQVGNNDVDYSDLWDYLVNGFYKAFELHGNYIWPKIADKFIDDNAIKQYRLLDLLGSGKSFIHENNSIFDILDSGKIINWCQNDAALIVVGRSISMFISNSGVRVINPLMLNLLSEFSDNTDFLGEISANFSSRSWSGSLVPYLEIDKELIKPLIGHENIKVKRWAIDFVEYIDNKIEYETKRNIEDNMLRS